MSKKRRNNAKNRSITRYTKHSGVKYILDDTKYSNMPSVRMNLKSSDDIDEVSDVGKQNFLLLMEKIDMINRRTTMDVMRSYLFRKRKGINVGNVYSVKSDAEVNRLLNRGVLDVLRDYICEKTAKKKRDLLKKNKSVSDNCNHPIHSENC